MDFRLANGMIDYTGDDMVFSSSLQFKYYNLNISPGSDLVVKYSSVYNTRSSNQYVRPFANTNSYSFSFFPRISFNLELFTY